jgi:hypothetical protein
VLPLEGTVSRKSDGYLQTSTKRQKLELIQGLQMFSLLFVMVCIFLTFFFIEYDRTNDKIYNMKGPSSAAKPGYFFYHQANEETRLIFNRRPFESTGPSIFLYNEVFGLFLQDFKDVSIPNDFYKWTKELLWIAASGYVDEKTRQGIMMEKFQELWGVVHKEQNPDNSASDGVLM